MLKSFLSLLLIIFTLSLSACASGVSGLTSYADTLNGYEFLYPNGWTQVNVKEASGVSVVFRDIIERTENLSVVISDVPQEKSLAELGSPSEVGYRFLQKVNQDPQVNREADFLSAEAIEKNDQTYYILEYQVKIPNNQERHNIASIAVNNGKLFTFNLSTNQSRWNKVQQTFKAIVKSFSIY